MIEKATQLTKVSGDPSKLDAEQYHHILLCKKHKKEAKDLREQFIIAIFAKKLATSLVDPTSIEAFTTSHLIPLNKIPGIRPIGVGEVLWRIGGKATSWVLKDDKHESAGTLQSGTGLKGDT